MLGFLHDLLNMVIPLECKAGRDTLSVRKRIFHKGYQISKIKYSLDVDTSNFEYECLRNCATRKECDKFIKAYERKNKVKASNE